MLINRMVGFARRFSANSRPSGVLVSAWLLFGLCAGCTEKDNVLGPWKEEVKLSDGRVIVVQRFESFDINRPIGDPSSSFVQAARVKIVEPPDLAGIPELVMPYRPVIFDFDPVLGRFYAIGVTDNPCWLPQELQRKYMDPTRRFNIHPNFEFRLIDGAWTGVPIGPERLGLKANLLIKRTTIDRFDVLPLSEKAAVDFDNRIPKEYRQIEPRLGCR
jgi:hypothetical protein